MNANDRYKIKRAVQLMKLGELQDAADLLVEMADLEPVDVMKFNPRPLMPVAQDAEGLGSPPVKRLAFCVGCGARDHGGTPCVPERSRPMLVRPLPLPFKRVVNEPLLKAYRREHEACEVCGRDAEHTHHLIERSTIRLDVEWNLLAVCSECHEFFHRGRGARWLRTWFVEVRHCFDRETRRRIVFVLFIVLPWIKRGGRDG